AQTEHDQVGRERPAARVDAAGPAPCRVQSLHLHPGDHLDPGAFQRLPNPGAEIRVERAHHLAAGHQRGLQPPIDTGCPGTRLAAPSTAPAAPSTSPASSSVSQPTNVDTTSPKSWTSRAARLRSPVVSLT